VRGRRRSNPPANLTYLNVPLSPDRHGHSRGPRTHQITHLSRLRETNAVRPIYSRYWGASGVADLRLQNVQDSRDGSDEAESAARIWPNGGPKTKSHLSAATRTICFADRTDRRPSSVRPARCRDIHDTYGDEGKPAGLRDTRLCCPCSQVFLRETRSVQSLDRRTFARLFETRPPWGARCVWGQGRQFPSSPMAGGFAVCAFANEPHCGRPSGR
jgi:hypothetical protein